MDEYTILKKKRQKNGFAATSLLISIAIALLVLVGAVLILGKVDNKQMDTANDDSTMTLGSSADVTCVGLTKEMVFNSNLRNIKEAAISYFTNERLPKKVGETVKITLKEMQSEKLILNVIDGSNKLCFDEKSYVEVTKDENEYLMKIFLSCSDMEDYILVHLGCYDYCDSNVCEKKETPKKYEYEYKKTTSCVMTDWSNWGNWQLTKEKTSNLKKEDTKVEITKKEIVDVKSASKEATTFNCNKYPGYSLVGDKCVKMTSTKEIIDAEKSQTVYSCPSSEYVLNGTKCERTVAKQDIKNGTYVCPSDYDQVGATCYKTTSKTETIDATPVYDTKKVYENYTCYQNECTTKTVFMCPTGQSCGNYPQTSCEKVKKTCSRSKDETYISGYTCPNGYSKNGSKCSITTTSQDQVSATLTCPNGYNKNNGKCVSNYQEKEIINATASKDKYTCKAGYTLNGTKCEKEIVVKDIKEATKVPGKYVCPSSYTFNNLQCTKKVTQTVKTTYYRYATRSCNGGSTSIKWSTSNNDSILLSEGYKLTGAKKEIK